jgi:hypothetical protein
LACRPRQGVVVSNLLARLRKGPLRTDDFAEVSASANSLKCRVFHLREKGITIESVDLPGTALRRPKVEYRLLNGICPCCEQDLAP